MKPTKCAVCGSVIPYQVPGLGRWRLYCSPECRELAAALSIADRWAEKVNAHMEPGHQGIKRQVVKNKRSCTWSYVLRGPYASLPGLGQPGRNTTPADAESIRLGAEDAIL